MVLLYWDCSLRHESVGQDLTPIGFDKKSWNITVINHPKNVLETDLNGRL